MRTWLTKLATLDFISWKGLQAVSIISYAISTIIFGCIAAASGGVPPLLVTSAMSLLVMIGRCIWTYDAGLWGNSKRSTRSYSQAVRKKHLALWSPAFLPERTAVVSLILLGYLSLSGWSGPVATTLTGLFATGGLLAAVVTSPHALFELQAKLDEAQAEATG